MIGLDVMLLYPAVGKKFWNWAVGIQGGYRYSPNWGWNLDGTDIEDGPDMNTGWHLRALLGFSMSG